jgi:PucR family transcriptional regulator, purine catabolism regulatory protein
VSGGTGEVTVRAVLGLEDLAAGRPEVLTGHDRLDTPVRWLHIAGTEELGAVLEGGELVLSAGTTLRTSEPHARTFLERLEAAGAVGVVIELIEPDGTFDAAAREVLGRAAVGRSMPVVVLHRHVFFVRITQAAHRLLIGRQLARVEQSRHVHEVFTELSLQGATEQQIVETAAELVGDSVVLEDAAHRVLAFHAIAEPADDLLENWAARARHDGKGGEEPAERRWLQVPVGIEGRRWGRLVAPDVDRGDPALSQILERAGQAVTLARMVSRDERDLLQQARSGFVHELMGPHSMDEHEALARAGSLGSVSSPRYVPVAIRLLHDARDQPTDVQMRERAALDSFVSAARSLGPTVLAGGLRPGAFAAILGVSTFADVDQVLTVVLDRTRSHLDLGGSDHQAPWTVGVGSTTTSLVRAGAALENAAQVADIVTTMDIRPQPFYRFADVRLRGVLSARRDDPALQAFVASELGPLLHDGDDESLELLARYLEHGGNVAALSRAVHLSRPALYARIARLEERLGVSLNDAESRTSLHTALLWLRVGGAAPAKGDQPLR